MKLDPRLAVLCRLILFFALVGFLVVLLAHCTGCQSYRYQSPSGATLTVTRLMTDAQVGTLEVAAPDGVTLRIEGLKSESEKIAEAVARGVVEGMK